jgi:hypothetical protein
MPTDDFELRWLPQKDVGAGKIDSPNRLLRRLFMQGSDLFSHLASCRQV